MGGSYVGPTQDRILRLADSLGIKTYKVNAKGDFIHYSRVQILPKSTQSARRFLSRKPNVFPLLQGRANRFNTTWPTFRNPLAILDVNNMMHDMDKRMDEVTVTFQSSSNFLRQHEVSHKILNKGREILREALLAVCPAHVVCVHGGGGGGFLATIRLRLTNRMGN